MITRRNRFIIFLALAILSIAPVSSRAESSVSDKIRFKPEITIPGLLEGEWEIDGTTIAQYIRVMFIVFVWAVGIVATVMVVYGGIKWVAAAGNPGRINDARDIINSAIIGVIIALSSIVLLNIINPRLTSFQGLDVKTVDPIIANFTEDLVTSAGALAVCPNTKVNGSPTQVCSGNHPPENTVGWDYQCSKTLNSRINDWADTYDVDANFIKAIILIETPPSPRGNDFVYSGPELDNGPGYGLGQFKTLMTIDTLNKVNNGYPPQCNLNDLKNASNQRLPTNCREWLDRHLPPRGIGKAGLNVQVGMIAYYLHTLLANKGCIKGDIILAAAAYNQGLGGAGATFCSPGYLSKASPERLASIKAQALEYISRVKQKYATVCYSATK